MAYAAISDVEKRISRELTESERTACKTLLDDAAAVIDSVAPNAKAYPKEVVSCRMVIRALGDGSQSTVPIGATQGSMSGLGYSQSWTVGTGGSVGELYLSRQDRRLLGAGNAIGSYSPVEELSSCLKVRR